MVSEIKSGTPDALLRVDGLTKTFIQNRPFSARKFVIHALRGVNLAIPRKSRFALVGESGSGKSTLALCLARLETLTSGKIWFDGKTVDGATTSGLTDFRRRVQIILQDTAGSLNPWMSAEKIIAEPLEVHGIGTASERRQRAASLMDDVGLPAARLRDLPHQFSGGERQRLAIARALALSPEFLILDEGLVGLDLLAQAHLVKLLTELQDERGLTYLFISHDLRLMLKLATEIAILVAGQVVEQGSPKEILANAHHPKTCALLQAIPGRTLKIETGQA